MQGALPPNLRGDPWPAGALDHWKLLLARHGRGINVAMVDGSVHWTPLEDLYMLQWKGQWTKYRLRIPIH
jgi:prepilin-type processing-associated H-X9-DG protein